MANSEHSSNQKRPKKAKILPSGVNSKDGAPLEWGAVGSKTGGEQGLEFEFCEICELWGLRTPSSNWGKLSLRSREAGFEPEAPSWGKSWPLGILKIHLDPVGFCYLFTIAVISFVCCIIAKNFWKAPLFKILDFAILWGFETFTVISSRFLIHFEGYFRFIFRINQCFVNLSDRICSFWVHLDFDYWANFNEKSFFCWF